MPSAFPDGPVGTLAVLRWEQGPTLRRAIWRKVTSHIIAPVINASDEISVGDKQSADYDFGGDGRWEKLDAVWTPALEMLLIYGQVRAALKLIGVEPVRAP